MTYCACSVSKPVQAPRLERDEASRKERLKQMPQPRGRDPAVSAGISMVI
jgi:hypothetical protein